MQEEQAREDLRFIRQMLEETRQNVADNGLQYINWTIMPALGIIGSYLIVLTNTSTFNILWIWVGAIGLGWLISFFIGSKQTDPRNMNFAERLLTAIWVATGITMTIVAFTGALTDSFSPIVIPALISTILGIPYFSASLIYELSWFRWIAFGWWTAGIVFFIWNSFHSLAVLGILLILFQALPGIYLYKQYRQNTKKASNEQ